MCIPIWLPCPQGDPLKLQSSACSEEDSVHMHPLSSLQPQLLELSLAAWKFYHLFCPHSIGRTSLPHSWCLSLTTALTKCHRLGALQTTEIHFFRTAASYNELHSLKLGSKTLLTGASVWRLVGLPHPPRFCLRGHFSRIKVWSQKRHPDCAREMGKTGGRRSFPITSQRCCLLSH